MNLLYLECAMGAAGDMLAAALLELHPDHHAVLQRLNALGIPGVRFHAEPACRCGIRGTRLRVTVDGAEEGEPASHGHHHHVTLQDVQQLIEQLELPEPVKQDSLAVYTAIAEAEGRVHGQPVELVHFHEVGSLDAIADVTAVCLLLHELAPDRITASPVHVGSGQIHCAHGILPVPAPATAQLLCGVPTYGGTIDGELCTPTGAALLKHFVQTYGPQPLFRVQKIGCGCGKREFAQANCVRAFWGEDDTAPGTL